MCRQGAEAVPATIDDSSAEPTPALESLDLGLTVESVQGVQAVRFRSDVLVPSGKRGARMSCDHVCGHIGRAATWIVQRRPFYGHLGTERL